MHYSKFIFQAKEKTISQLDNGTWYLEPEWKDIICRDIESNIESLEDSYVADWWDIENILRLETERRNLQDNKKGEVINWIYDLITTTVEPAMLEEETEYIKHLTEYLKTKQTIEDNNN